MLGEREQRGAEEDNSDRDPDQLVTVVKKWESIVQADDAEQFAVFKKRIEQFVEFRKELVRRAE